MLKFLAIGLFGSLVGSAIVAIKAAPVEPGTFFTPAIVTATFASAFMGVLLEILRPSK
ncbi:Hypothetical protein I1A_000036 (plasmid) [Pseudomonas fluorescens R124]|uniref:Uncharacterized protein n=1 Tax=Pseudomonas fluorescens R124 TaxID=743713 RepID=K0WNI8_PSEFL|nr:hypothetical protein [Pseudomonas fluorescens]AFS51712.1 hypothetical protein I1A_000036 [Pseudomonas fluorescens R124]EJZ60957.1 Hypothetical protein I1A_000036 [Pseudomonas fluorescens R124]